MLYPPLKAHQERIVDFAERIPYPYCGIFADYGSGKTLCALELIRRKQWRRVLVVSTKLAIELTWVDEIRKWTDFHYLVLFGTQQHKQRLIRRAIVQLESRGLGFYHRRRLQTMCFLVNFDGIKNIYHDLINVGFDAIIVDESTKIKDIRRVRTQVLCKLGSTIPHRLIMTGFPITEQLTDLYAQIKFLDGGKTFGTSYHKFLNTYFAKVGLNKVVPKFRADKKIIEAISPFCIRVSNESVSLPPEVFKRVRVDQTPQQRRLLTELNQSFSVEFGKVKYDTEYIFALLTKGLQICDGFITDKEGKVEVIETEKDKALLDILEEINVYKNKVVIWANFLFSVKKIARILERCGYRPLVLTGETKYSRGAVEKFQSSSKYNVLIASQKKAAESITLTACRYAVYYSNTWSGDLRMNSRARIRRIGSEKHASIIYTDITTKGGPDELVYKCLQEKKRIIELLKKTFETVGGAEHVIIRD